MAFSPAELAKEARNDVSVWELLFFIHMQHFVLYIRNQFAYSLPQYIEESRRETGDEKDLSPFSHEVRYQHHNTCTQDPEEILNFSRQRAITGSNQFQNVHIVAYKHTSNGGTRAETKKRKERQTVHETRCQTKPKLGHEKKDCW